MPKLSTTSIHGADHLSRVPDVMPPINISTTFRYDNDPSKLVKIQDLDPNLPIEDHVYSRETHPNASMVEEIIGKMTGAHAVSYSSGLSAFFAALTYFNPKVVAIGNGYHGCHEILDIFKENWGVKEISLTDDFSQLGKGDIVHLETPVNPDGTSFDISEFAKKAHERGALLIVDATLAPPPLMDPFLWGADMVMHSATKYFGGHSDLLAGILLSKDPKVKTGLIRQRIALGSIISNLESSFLLRSLRTHELRVMKQSENATKIVKFLDDNKEKYSQIVSISHGSLQTEDFITKQMPNGHSALFSVIFSTEEYARAFPSKLKYFLHATSLGGVESLVEWRALSDDKIDPRLVRFSIGVESVDDLIDDLKSALV